VSGKITRYPRVVDLQRQDHPRSVIRIGHHDFPSSSNLAVCTRLS
jgi:hypothetical protein